jgi:hypothetical protein
MVYQGEAVGATISIKIIIRSSGMIINIKLYYHKVKAKNCLKSK